MRLAQSAPWWGAVSEEACGGNSVSGAGHSDRDYRVHVLVQLVSRGISERPVELDAELSCGNHVTLVQWPEDYFTVCPWCPVREVQAIVAIDGKAV